VKKGRPVKGIKGRRKDGKGRHDGRKVGRHARKRIGMKRGKQESRKDTKACKWEERGKRRQE
jgi:hypothetical protein